ncbi:unnamed protein product [Miscanthus lutarioriparius]|uniref:Disease resistance R13L4/SHOC-2-like LRR domain-containing protein n=1 Tax=Miscanthus lutarioriparius TaxID=422564 RepID=A0A811QEB9_9POAL|nr:unnamed protein product [Miscanthus lutarioriparius]
MERHQRPACCAAVETPEEQPFFTASGLQAEGRACPPACAPCRDSGAGTSPLNPGKEHPQRPGKLGQGTVSISIVILVAQLSLKVCASEKFLALSLTEADFQGPQGKETGRVMSSNNEILMEDEVNHGGGLTSYHRIPTSRKDVAISWFDQFSLFGHNEEVVFNVKGLEAQASLDLFRKEVQDKNLASPLKNSDDKELEQPIVKCGRLPKVIIAVAKFLAPKTVTCMESTRTLNCRFMHELESNPEFHGLRDLFGWMHSYFRTCPDFLRPSTNVQSLRMIRCQVSAFFHEYIISRPDEENIIFALEVFALKGRCLPTTRRTGRHLVIESSWDRDRIVFESIDFSRLRSLTVFGEWESFFISKSMKVLRVLDLENATGVTDKDLKLMVKLLPRLKFLSLRGSSGIRHLPSSLGELRQLETLDVRHTSIVTLPASITKLKKLQYIRAGTTFPAGEPSTPCRSHKLVGVEVPVGIDKLTALHTLGVVNAGFAGGKDSLKELKKITQLRKLGVFGVNKKNCTEFCAAIACRVRLESLSVWLSKGNEECLDDISMHLEKPLEKIQQQPQGKGLEKPQHKAQEKPQQKTQGKPLGNLQSLKLRGLVKQVPSWIKDLLKLTKLELEITMSEEVEVINVLGEIKELCILRLCVKPLQDADGKLDFCVWVNGIQQRCYLNFKILEITCSSKLNICFGSEAMQNLELLTARCCSGSTLKFMEIKNLSKQKLKEVRLISSHDTALKDDIEKQLEEHPRNPPLKLEELEGR